MHAGLEAGDVILIGATTENPSFEVNAALLSRSKVFVLKPLDEAAIVRILRKAMTDTERGLGREQPEASDEALAAIARYANGDARAALNLLQLALPRAHTFEADRAAALLTGDPLGLASAISRLDVPAGVLAEDLVPPVPARKVPLPSLLRYPAAAERRIARLNALQAPPMPALDIADGPRISLVGVGPIEMRPRYRWPGIWF